MRLLLLNTSFPPMASSAAHLFYDLGRSLQVRGHQVDVSTELPWRRLGATESAAPYRGLRFQWRETMEGMDVLRVRGFPFRENSMIGRGINALLLPFTFYLGARSLGRQDVALVYCPPLTLGLAAFFLWRLHKIPFVFNVQDIYPQTIIELGMLSNPVLIRFFEWIERFTYTHATCIVVHSEGNRQYLIARRQVPPEKVVVLSNWVDTELIRPADRHNDFREQHDLGTHFLVGYAGTMGYAQDLNPIIQAAETLQDHKDILFLLIGEGALAGAWRQRVAELRLANVRFLPLQPKTVYPALVSALDVGLVPLTEELRTPVVPGKLLDYMAGSRPVIATVNLDGDASRIIREANCGYAFSPRDGSQVARTILELYRSPALGQHLGASGRAYAVKHFSLDACVAQYEVLFNRIIEKHKAERQEGRAHETSD